MSRPIEVAPVRPDELAAAFRLIFQHVAADEQEVRIVHALNLVQQGELSTESVLVAHGPRGLTGALVCESLPGASGLLWLPQTVAGLEHEAVADELVRTGLARLRLRGARLVQTLLLPAETPQAAPLQRNGFRHVTSLWYLRHDLTLPASLRGAEDWLTCQPYPRCDRDLFHQTLMRSYEGTLDCPEINGLRRLEEILEGHRAQGVYDPERWWLARLDDVPVGVLILAGVPDSSAWDVSYVGVIPEARRRGVGHGLLGRALLEARLLAADSLTLAVDARNLPARQLYQRLGFEAYEQREVFLAMFRKEE